MARKFLGLVFLLGAMAYASSLGASPASEHRVWSIIGFEREELPIDKLQSIEHMIEGGHAVRCMSTFPEIESRPRPGRRLRMDRRRCPGPATQLYKDIGVNTIPRKACEMRWS